MNARKANNLATHQRTNLQTQKLINTSTHELTNSKTQIVIFYFTNPRKFSLRSSANMDQKAGKMPLFLTFHTFLFVCF